MVLYRLNENKKENSPKRGRTLSFSFTLKKKEKEVCSNQQEKIKTPLDLHFEELEKKQIKLDNINDVQSLIKLQDEDSNKNYLIQIEDTSNDKVDLSIFDDEDEGLMKKLKRKSIKLVNDISNITSRVRSKSISIQNKNKKV